MKTYLTLFNVALIIPISLAVATLVQASGVVSNIGIAYGLTVGLTAGVMVILEYLSAQVLVEYAKWTALKVLKKHGYNSVEDATKDLMESAKYMTQLQSLPPDIQQEVVDKAKRTGELIKDYEVRPDFYFKNMNMTKEEAIKQVRTDFNNWMKQKGLPTWTPRNLQ